MNPAIKALFCALFLFIFAGQAQAEHQTFEIAELREWLGDRMELWKESFPATPSRNWSVKMYAPYPKILFLGEGEAIHAGAVHAAYPKKIVYAADIIYQPPFAEVAPNFFKVYMDNTRPFPFKADSFDAVIMQRGLCACEKPDLSCGGIPLSIDGMHDFLTQVARVLNKRNSASVSFLEGGNETKEVFEKWIKASDEVMSENPVRVSFVVEPKEKGQAIHVGLKMAVKANR